MAAWCLAPHFDTVLAFTTNKSGSTSSFSSTECQARGRSLINDKQGDGLLLMDRRQACATAFFGCTTSPLVAQATDPGSILSELTTAESVALETGLLDSRVTENLLSPPPFGMEGPDVFYPL
jgi:hypothetical protein